MMHPWLLFVPIGRLVRALGLGMTGLAVFWRVASGSLIALSLHFALKPTTRRVGVAAGLAAFLLCDSGMMFGQLVRREGEVVASLLLGSSQFLTGVPRLMPHLRVVTPGLALPALFLHLGAMVRARRGGGLFCLWLAIGSFGLLFHVYFYYWTMVGLGLVLAFGCDRDGRRLYLTVLVGGLAIGAPALWESSQIKRSTPIDWLWRTNKFVAIGHFDELLWPKGLIVSWLLVAYWVFRKRRELIYAWCCTGGGLICLNHQILTGLQIENEHWSGAYGATFSLLLAGLIAPGVERAIDSGRAWRVAVAGILAVQVTLGFGLRGVEAIRSGETLAMARLVSHWRADSGYRNCPRGSVVAGDPDILFLAAGLSTIRPLSCRLVEFSALADDAELDERLLLNAYLIGFERGEMLRRVELPPGSLSWEAAATRSARWAQIQRDRRRSLIDQIWADPRPWVEKYEVSRVVIPAESQTKHLEGLAQFESRGLLDQVWRVAHP